MKNFIIHGIHTKDPKGWVGKVGGYLESFELFKYGWFSLISVLFKNKKEATKLMKLIKKSIGKVVLYAHSNGGAISVESARQGAEIDYLICINAALKRNTIFPDSIKNVLVIHTKHDIPTKAARFFDAIPIIGLFIPNAWGAMGAYGSNSLQKKVVNWDLSNILNGHDDFFETKNLVRLMPHIKKWVEESDYDIAEQEQEETHLYAIG